MDLSKTSLSKNSKKILRLLNAVSCLEFSTALALFARTSFKLIISFSPCYPLYQEGANLDIVVSFVKVYFLYLKRLIAEPER
jgi:hypothetical protein